MAAISQAFQTIVEKSIPWKLYPEQGIKAGGLNEVLCKTDKWTEIVDVAMSKEHTVGLRKDGTVLAAGLNDDRQCEVSAWQDIIGIAVGDALTVGLQADGTLVYTNSPRMSEHLRPIREWKNLVAVYVADSFYGLPKLAGLTADGQVYCLGDRSCASWKLFDSVDTLEQEAKSKKAGQDLIADLQARRAKLGFFDSKAKNEIDLRIKRIHDELSRISQNHT